MDTTLYMITTNAVTTVGKDVSTESGPFGIFDTEKKAKENAERIYNERIKEVTNVINSIGGRFIWKWMSEDRTIFSVWYTFGAPEHELEHKIDMAIVPITLNKSYHL